MGTLKIMSKNPYDKHYFRRYSHYLSRDLAEIPLFAKIWEWVSQDKPIKILDVGCGIGYLLSWLCRKAGSKGWGIDSSKEAINRAPKLYPGIRISLGKATNLPFKNRFFDCVLMVNLIEHLEEEEQKDALIETERVLKDKGILILSTPERNSLYTKLMIHDPTHQKELTKKELLPLIEKDFQVKEVIYTNAIGRFGKKANFFLSQLMPADILVKAEK